MQSAAVRDEHPSRFHRQEDVGDAAAHAHRISMQIESVRPLHPPLGEDDDHRMRIDFVQQFEPCVIAFARDGDDMMRDELEDHSDQRPAGGFIRGRHDSMRGETPHEVVRDCAEEHGLEEAGVIEEGDEADFAPRIRRHVTDPADVVSIEDPAHILERDQHREDHEAPQQRHGDEA